MMKAIVCVFLAVSISCVEGACPSVGDPTMCAPPVNMGDTSYCTGLLTYIACLKTHYLDNTDCTQAIKSSITSQVDNQRLTMKQTPACADYVCPITSCSPPMGATGDDMCSKITAFYLCLKNGAANDKCDAVYVAGAQATLATANTNLNRSGCEVLPDCTFLVCDTLPSSSSDEYCSKGKDFVSCLRTKIVQNDLCDESSKTAAKELADNAETGLEDKKCNAATSLVSSITACLVVSWIAYFFSA